MLAAMTRASIIIPRGAATVMIGYEGRARVRRRTDAAQLPIT